MRAWDIPPPLKDELIANLVIIAKTALILSTNYHMATNQNNNQLFFKNQHIVKFNKTSHSEDALWGGEGTFRSALQKNWITDPLKAHFNNSFIVSCCIVYYKFELREREKKLVKKNVRWCGSRQFCGGSRSRSRIRFSKLRIRILLKSDLT